MRNTKPPGDDGCFGCCMWVGLGSFLLVCVMGWKLFSAGQEAATYRRLTGNEVTTWDALWVELRVQDSVRDK